MSDFPLIGVNRYEASTPDANSGGVILTADATANTKAATYTTLIASTAFHASWIIIELGWWTGTAGEFLVDIAVGAAAAEQIIVADLCFSGPAGDHSVQYMFPVNIPPGVRLSARCQSTTGSNTVRCQVQLAGQGFLPPSPLGLMTTYGADGSDSGGVNIEPGATVDTKGVYSVLSTSTTYPIHWLNLGIGGQANIARTGYRWSMDIAIGGEGSEQVIIPDLFLAAGASGDIMLPGTFILPCYIPAGSRLAARAQCSGNNAADRLFDLIAYGAS